MGAGSNEQRQNFAKGLGVDSFFLIQTFGTVCLWLSGEFSGNEDRATTGLANTAKNAFSALAPAAANINASAVQQAVLGGRIQVATALLSAGTNLPQFLGNIGSQFAESFGALSGVLAYGAIAADYLLKSNNMRRLGKTVDALGMDRKEIVFERNGKEVDLKTAQKYMLDRKRKGEWGQHVFFGVLPSILLAYRGISFAAIATANITSLLATGAAFATPMLLAGPLLMLAAGAIFAYGAYKHFKSNNPDFELSKTAEYLLRPLKAFDGDTSKTFVQKMGWDTSDQIKPEDKITFKRKGDIQSYDVDLALRKKKQIVAEMAAQSPAPGMS